MRESDSEGSPGPTRCAPGRIRHIHALTGRTGRAALGAFALGAVLAVVGCGGGTKTVTSTSSPASSAAMDRDFVDVISRVSPEVVQVATPQGLGSGVVFDSSGDVVTNAHVVVGGPPYQITDSRGRKYTAGLVGAFVPDDLAVIKAQGASLPSATLANSQSLRVGDLVLAIGNPLGLRSSVTNGIISALGRTVNESNGVVLPDVIQTSAPINPGNSGGALVNLQGQVVGIPTLAATDPQLGGGAAPGIGFAIPSSLVSDIAGQIIRYGRVIESRRAYLGIQFATGLVNGAVVAAVQQGGPAQQAGITPGDVITSIDKQVVASTDDVATILATLKPGQLVPVGIVSPDGSQSVVNVRLGQYQGSAA